MVYVHANVSANKARGAEVLVNIQAGPSLISHENRRETRFDRFHLVNPVDVDRPVNLSDC